MWTVVLLCVWPLLAASVARACPTDCQCENGTVLCTGLDSLPTDLPDGTAELTCDDCIIPVLGLVASADVAALAVRRSGVTEMTADVFSVATKLRTVDLSDNALTDASSFSGLHHLTDLILTGNRLTSLPVFDLPSLAKIDLSRNPGLVIREDAFSSCPVLTHLSLRAIGLAAVPMPLLAALPSLRALDLDGNDLGSLPNGGFMVSSNLQELNLARCAIVDVDPGAFAGLDALLWLQLANNSIATLPPLHEVADTLRRLHLEGNRLSSLDESDVNWKGMAEVRLARNPWHCDCEIAWMAEIDLSNDDALCASPSSVANQSLHAVTASLSCGVNMAVLLGVMIPVIIILLAVFVFFCVRVIFDRYPNLRGRHASAADSRKSARHSAVYRQTTEAADA